jgi:NAD(P)H-hydrate epimerase
MQKVDAATIASVVPGIELMERAGTAVAKAIRARYPTGHAAIFVGPGNNGGDGLVVARHLVGTGWSCSIHMLKRGALCTPDTAANHALLVKGHPVMLSEFDATADDWPAQAAIDLAGATLIIDSIFGTGFSGVPRERAAEAIVLINRTRTVRKIPVVSIDVPSGVNGTTGETGGDSVRADLTLTIGAAKTGLLFHPGRSRTGELEVLDIGFPKEIVEANSETVFYLDRAATAAKIPPRAPDIHKYKAGLALVIAGSERYRGAAVLAAEAALRGGCGMVCLAVPDDIHRELPMSLKEAIVLALPQTSQGTIAATAGKALAQSLEKADAVAIGPGLDPNDETDAFVRDFVVNCPKPVVVDAGGLTAFVGHAQEFAKAKSPVIITPHDGELSRLTGEKIPTTALERIAFATRTARELRVTLVHKGAPSLIVSPEGDVWINGSGTSALAKGGTGDVLTGLAVSFLAQDVAAAGAAGTALAMAAACVACFLHGRAGELEAAEHGERGVIASDLLKAVGRAMIELEAISS